MLTYQQLQCRSSRPLLSQITVNIPVTCNICHFKLLLEGRQVT